MRILLLYNIYAFSLCARVRARLCHKIILMLLEWSGFFFIYLKRLFKSRKCAVRITFFQQIDQFIRSLLLVILHLSIAMFFHFLLQLPWKVRIKYLIWKCTLNQKHVNGDDWVWLLCVNITYFITVWSIEYCTLNAVHVISLLAISSLVLLFFLHKYCRVWIR